MDVTDPYLGFEQLVVGSDLFWLFKRSKSDRSVRSDKNIEQFVRFMTM